MEKERLRFRPLRQSAYLDFSRVSRLSNLWIYTELLIFWSLVIGHSFGSLLSLRAGANSTLSLELGRLI